MIQHTKKIIKLSLLIISISSLSCKQNDTSAKLETEIKEDNIEISKENNSTLKENNSTLKENDSTLKEDFSTSDDWKFYKSVSLSNSDDCNNNKYEDFYFSISNDSVFINNNYTDNVISGELKSDVLYKKYGISKEFLLKNFNISLPDKIKYVRNVKAYDSSSKLEDYFRDAFYIDKYIVFEFGGCVYCYEKKKGAKTLSQSYEQSLLPISSQSLSKMKSIDLDKKVFFEYACGSQPKGFFLGKRDDFDIFIVNNDCGDFVFRDLLVVKSNKIVSKLNIESDSWDIEKEESQKIKDENIVTFNIDKELMISLKSINKLNNKTKKESKIIYNISKGKFIEVK